MKIVVIGASGLIGSKVVTQLARSGHDVVKASTRSGVNVITGEGLDKALGEAEVVVDVTNSPSFEEKAAMDFFETSNHNIVEAEVKAGVKHHVALSVVGTERLLEMGYFRAKLAQERMIKESPIPYTIVRSTQFFEFLSGIANESTVEQTVRLPPDLFQPIASDDVATILADVAVNPPVNGVIEIAGPERTSLAGLIKRYLLETSDTRNVVVDTGARFFGVALNDHTLTPGDNARLGFKSFERWLHEKE
jgi:uncharacterized protein YbjT (DUF2867 family)